MPDYHARLPKPCVGGWGRRSLNVTPSGKVLPCHAAPAHEQVVALAALHEDMAYAYRQM